MVIRFLKYHLPIIVYLIIIFIFSSIPGDDLPELSFTISDKLIHGIIYLIAFYLFYLSFSNVRKDSVFYKNAILFSFIFTVIYAISDELHQALVPNRDADIFDLLADFIGAFIGFIIMIALVKIKPKKIIL